MDRVDELSGKIFCMKPHEVFVQLSELNEENTFWVEQSRWIKYEECKEEGAERWGRPHLSSLSFHSLTNLRMCFDKAIVNLDFNKTKGHQSVAQMIVEQCFAREYIKTEELKTELSRLLSLPHQFVDSIPGKTRNTNTRRTIKRTFSQVSRRKSSLTKRPSVIDRKDGTVNEGFGINMENTDGTENEIMQTDQAHQHDMHELEKHGMKSDTEGTLVLVGTWKHINEPLCAFVRLEEGNICSESMEIPVPLRFVFLLLTPEPSKSSLNYINPHEVGRSFSTMMSDPGFRSHCYQMSAREELIIGFDEVLDSSIVLPVGDRSLKNLISTQEIQQLQHNDHLMKESSKVTEDSTKPPSDSETIIDNKDKEKSMDEKEYDPLKRGPYPFNGVYDDLKHRFPHYLSDFRDAINGQCAAATVFIYFAALSGAVTFGGLTGDATKGQIGVPETLITSAVAGVLFALFSGQPLIITGLTGPILLYDESLFNFSDSMGVDFLQWRVWIGLWLLLIAIVVAAFQGSVLVRFFTKFTKDIFSSLVSLLFIVSSLQKLNDEFVTHPLKPKEHYCSLNTSTNQTTDNSTMNNEDDDVCENEPNTALLSFLLMFGTFLIAYGLKVLRNGKYMGRTIRRALGDFGVPIAIVVMVGVDYMIGDKCTKKLDVPFGLQTTLPERGWLINPLMSNLTVTLNNGTILEGARRIPIWLPFVSFFPAFLLFLLLFIETEICELLMMEKSKKKGGGLHWDILLLCLINCCAAFFGGPWICAATVRAVAHVSALTVMSTNNAPGEAPHIVEVKDQRVSALIVSLLCGVSVFLAVALSQVPFAVLYGVFLYMGVSSINGIQLFERLELMFMPAKHYPRVGYTSCVRTWRMHMFTIIQLMGLAILWTVKSIPSIALAFPFFVVSMIGVRWSLKFLFTEKELDHLDGPNAGKTVLEEKDEPDFYEEGIGG